MITARISLGKYTLDCVRYAVYSLTGGVYAHIALSGGYAVVKLTPKPGAPPARLLPELKTALDDEKLREKLFAENRELREFMIRKALAPAGPAAAAPPIKGAAPPPAKALTRKEELELDRMIARIEKEVARGGASGGRARIAARWEDTYGGKKNGRAEK